MNEIIIKNNVTNRSELKKIKDNILDTKKKIIFYILMGFPSVIIISNLIMLNIRILGLTFLFILLSLIILIYSHVKNRAISKIIDNLYNNISKDEKHYTVVFKESYFSLFFSDSTQKNINYSEVVKVISFNELCAVYLGETSIILFNSSDFEKYKKNILSILAIECSHMNLMKIT